MYTHDLFLLLLFSLLSPPWSATPWTAVCQASQTIGILQATILEWDAMSFSKGSSRPRDWTCKRCLCVLYLLYWETGSFSTTWKALSTWIVFVVIQFLIPILLFATPVAKTTVRQASLSFIISQNSLKLMSIESVIPSNHLIFCNSLLFLPSIFSIIRVFSNELALLIRWQNYWSFSFSISPSNQYSGLISFRLDWFDLFAIEGTLKSLLQHHSSKASILWHSAFFTVQLSYVTTGKTIALTRQTFIGKVISLLFNMLSRFFIAFLLRSKYLLYSWLQSPSAEILEPKKIKYVTASTYPPSICHEVMGPDVMIIVFWMTSFKPAFSLSSFTLIKRLFSYSSLSAIRVVSSAYLRLLIFFQAILIPACASSSPAFHMMCSACKLNKQPWHIPFPIWKQLFLLWFWLLLLDWRTSFSWNRKSGLVFSSL